MMDSTPRKILNTYTVPGKWYCIKYILFSIVLYFRRIYSYLELAFQPDREQFIKDKNNKLDVAQPLSDHLKAFNAVFFIAANAEGYYVIAGTERRQFGIICGLFYLIIPGKGLLCSPKIPDTLLFGANHNEFGAEGLLITPVESMKNWKISYTGKMRYQNDDTKVVDVDFKGDWNAKWKHFIYDTNLHIPAVARSIAKENWTRSYFENLKAAHQSHYEQFGKMHITLTVDGEKIETTLDSFRDHSFGHKRDWELMHRYAFHHIFCENGMSAAVGVICQPSTASSFEVGVVCLPSGENDLHAVEWCDMKLYQHGENGDPPTDYAFQFQAGGIVYTVEVEVHHRSDHFVGFNWEARMAERFVNYKVNGVRGWGVSEFHYNNKSGRPESYAVNDPKWSKDLELK